MSDDDDERTTPDAFMATEPAPAPKRNRNAWPVAVMTAPAIRDELAARRARTKWEVPKVRDDRKRTPEELRQLIEAAQNPRPATPIHDPSAPRIRALEHQLRRNRASITRAALAIAASGMATTFIGGWIWVTQPGQIGGAISALGVAIVIVIALAMQRVW